MSPVRKGETCLDTWAWNGASRAGKGPSADQDDGLKRRQGQRVGGQGAEHAKEGPPAVVAMGQQVESEGAGQGRGQGGDQDRGSRQDAQEERITGGQERSQGQGERAADLPGRSQASSSSSLPFWSEGWKFW